MTPLSFYSAKVNARVFAVYSNGDLNRWTPVDSSCGLRPVVNVRSDVLISQGDGTTENPFILPY